MRRNWEVCQPGYKPGRWFAPQATMNKLGDIKISRFAWELLDCCEHAVLLFDREKRTIGIQPQRAAIRDTVPLVASGLHGARLIRAGLIRHQFNIPLDKTVRFTAPTIDEDGILTLDLRTARPFYHGGRVGAFASERKIP